MPVNNLADFALKLYPNPTNGLVNLQYTLPDKAKGKILLFSIDGKQVGKSVLHSANQSNSSKLFFRLK